MNILLKLLNAIPMEGYVFSKSPCGTIIVIENTFLVFTKLKIYPEKQSINKKYKSVNEYIV